ncbi:MAG: glycerophosphodiester phosphodiesterase family protein [Flavobacteriales bacterium]|nr:glycerophosphodiester phosphodiesterase family protein [Flavobacteriales bacterium]
MTRRPMRTGLAGLALMLAACTPPDRTGLHMVGHGGCGPGDVLPMNSRAALMTALESGMDGIELDVQLTADGVLVAFHDELLDDGAGRAVRVHALPWATVRACTVPGKDGAPHPIVRVDSLLMEAAAAYPRALFTLDCKLFAHGDWWTYLEQYTDAVAALPHGTGTTGRVQAECRVDDFLGLLRRKAPALPLYRYADDADEAMRIAADAGYAGITLHHARMGRAQVRQAHDMGLRVTLFGTANAWSERRAMRKGPDQLQTDRVPGR